MGTHVRPRPAETCPGGLPMVEPKDIFQPQRQRFEKTTVGLEGSTYTINGVPIRRLEQEKKKKDRKK
jgi:hypothetical protein